MNQALQDKIESEQYRKNAAEFNVGDSVKVPRRLGRVHECFALLAAGIAGGRSQLREDLLGDHFCVAADAD